MMKRIMVVLVILLELLFFIDGRSTDRIPQTHVICPNGEYFDHIRDSCQVKNSRNLFKFFVIF